MTHTAETGCKKLKAQLPKVAEEGELYSSPCLESPGVTFPIHILCLHNLEVDLGLAGACQEEMSHSKPPKHNNPIC